MRTRIAILEDQELVRRGLEELVKTSSLYEIVWSGSDPHDLVTAMNSADTHADVALLDVNLGGEILTPADVRKVTEAGTRVVIVSAMAPRPTIAALLAAGALGVVTKDDSSLDLLSAIQAAIEGDEWITAEMAAALAGVSESQMPALSAQEMNVLTMYANGIKVVTIARRLDISPNTVKDYLKRIRAKFADAGIVVVTQLDLHRQASRMGMVD